MRPKFGDGSNSGRRRGEKRASTDLSFFVRRKESERGFLFFSFSLERKMEYTIDFHVSKNLKNCRFGLFFNQRRLIVGSYRD